MQRRPGNTHSALFQKWPDVTGIQKERHHLQINIYNCFLLIYPLQRHNLPPTLEIITPNFPKKIKKDPKFSKKLKFRKKNPEFSTYS